MAERFNELKEEIQGFTRDERERRNFDPVDVLLKEAEPVPRQDTLDQLLKRISDLESKLSVLSDSVLLKQDLPPVSIDGTSINPSFCMLRTADLATATAKSPMNSRGRVFSTIQSAVDNVQDGGWVYVPQGTYQESVNVTNSNVVLYGAGWNTIIDGGVIGHGVVLAGNYCVVRDLQVITTGGGGNAYDAVRLAANYTSACRVYVPDSDQYGFYTIAQDTSLVDCVAQGCDSYEFVLNGPRTRMVGCRINGTSIINGAGDDSIITGCYMSGAFTIHVDAENCVVDGNRVPGGITDNSGTSTVGDNDTT